MQVIDNYAKMIFRNDNEYGTFYKIGLSRKDRNNEYINGYMNVKFKKGVSLENRTKIYINKAFIDFYLDKNNNTVTYLMITEFSLAEEQKKEENPFTDFGNVTETNEVIDDDLPF